nr:uncharacterized protein LOC105848873 isoform X2 [Hydra vulgaris]
MNVPATVQSPLSLEIIVKLPIFSMECSKYLNGLVLCRKHTLKDVCSELAHHLEECLPEGNPSIRKRFYNRVTVLLKQSYPICTFGEEGAFALVQRVPDMDHIRCLVRNMKCSLPYSEHKEHLFHPEISEDNVSSPATHFRRENNIC